MRCVTAMDAVRRRFGAANEQFFTWLQIPVGIFQAALWLIGLAIFLSAAFGFELERTIIVTGVIVVIITMLGGSWSTTASDFVQMLLLMPVTVVAAVLALAHVGGVGEFINRAPRHFWHWGDAANSKLMLFWVVAILIQRWVTINNMTDASRYLSVKDSRHARKAALLGSILFVVGPVVWFIPPMVARITHPDLSSMFPNVKQNTQETAYFAMAVTTMPVGMIGLLLSGIFASTMGQMDSGLNRNAGYFIKNFYQSQFRPHASERELLLAGRISTVVFGVLIIWASLWFAMHKDTPLFEIMQRFSIWIGLPVAIPLIWGMFIRRAPSWAGWSTVLIGLLASYLTQRYLSPAWISNVVGMQFSKLEGDYWVQAISVVVNVLVGSAWFLFTPLLASRRRESAEVERVDRFFADMRRPIDFAREEGAGSDNMQAKVMGLLCLIYGGFITLLVLIPNAWSKRWAFIFCGMVMFGIGWMLHRASRYKDSRAEAAARGMVTPAAVPADQP
jgi:Na+/proline symporter